MNKGIPFQMFKVFCLAGNKYTGDVQDFGYVYWREEQVPITLPDDFPIVPQARTTYITISSMKVIPYAKPDSFTFRNAEALPKGTNLKERQITEYHKFRYLMSELLIAVNNVNSTAGIANSLRPTSDKVVTIGSKYLQVNKGGTLIKNPNRTYTTERNLATKLGRKLLIAGIFIDIALVRIDKISKEEAFANGVINLGIFIIGEMCPPLGAALGANYLLFAIFETDNYGDQNYLEIHGAPTPMDNTRVVKRY